MERIRKGGESVYSVAKSLLLDADVVQTKVDSWNEILADHFKDKIIQLHQRHMPVDKIAEKSKLPSDLITRKLEEWGSTRSSLNKRRNL